MAVQRGYPAPTFAEAPRGKAALIAKRLHGATWLSVVKPLRPCLQANFMKLLRGVAEYDACIACRISSAAGPPRLERLEGVSVALS